MTKTEAELGRDQDISQDTDNRQISEVESTIAAEYEQRIPPAYRGLYRRAIGGKSRKAVIRSICLECVGWSPKEVRLCVTKGCPAYKYRLKG